MEKIPKAGSQTEEPDKLKPHGQVREQTGGQVKENPRRYECNGKRLTVRQIATISKKTPQNVYYLMRQGYSAQQIADGIHRERPKVTIKTPWGELTYKEAGAALNITADAMKARWRRWSADDQRMWLSPEDAGVITERIKRAKRQEKRQAEPDWQGLSSKRTGSPKKIVHNNYKGVRQLAAALLVSAAETITARKISPGTRTDWRKDVAWLHDDDSNYLELCALVDIDNRKMRKMFPLHILTEGGN